MQHTIYDSFFIPPSIHAMEWILIITRIIVSHRTSPVQMNSFDKLCDQFTKMRWITTTFPFEWEFATDRNRYRHGTKIQFRKVFIPFMPKSDCNQASVKKVHSLKLEFIYCVHRLWMSSIGDVRSTTPYEWHEYVKILRESKTHSCMIIIIIIIVWSVINIFFVRSFVRIHLFDDKLRKAFISKRNNCWTSSLSSTTNNKEMGIGERELSERTSALNRFEMGYSLTYDFVEFVWGIFYGV